MTVRKNTIKKANNVCPENCLEVLQTVQINYKDEKLNMISAYMYRRNDGSFYLSTDPKIACGFPEREVSRMFVDGVFVTNRVNNLLHKEILSILLERNIGEFSFTIYTYKFKCVETKEIKGITDELDYILNGDRYTLSIMSKLSDKERAYLEFKGID